MGVQHCVSCAQFHEQMDHFNQRLIGPSRQQMAVCALYATRACSFARERRLPVFLSGRLCNRSSSNLKQGLEYDQHRHKADLLSCQLSPAIYNQGHELDCSEAHNGAAAATDC